MLLSLLIGLIIVLALNEVMKMIIIAQTTNPTKSSVLMCLTLGRCEQI